MANNIRVKRPKQAIPFSVELELSDEEDDDSAPEPDKTPTEQSPDERAEAAETADEPEQPTSFKVGEDEYQFVETDTDEGVEIRRHWFRARPSVPGVLLLDLTASQIHKNTGYSAAAVRTFLEKAIDKRDRERFETLLTESDPPVAAEDMNHVIEFLMEQYGDRPTARPKP